MKSTSLADALLVQESRYQDRGVGKIDLFGRESAAGRTDPEPSALGVVQQ
jgi:hypothetical protein